MKITHLNDSQTTLLPRFLLGEFCRVKNWVKDLKKSLNTEKTPKQKNPVFTWKDHGMFMGFSVFRVETRNDNKIQQVGDFKSPRNARAITGVII